MGKSTVFANRQGISSTNSDAVTVSGPDVCLTPAGPSLVPVPYTNVARSASLVDGTKTVTVDGGMAAIDGCSYSRSTGDEAGIGKGVGSATVAGRAEFINCSFDVSMEGRGVCRNQDPMTHNNRNALGMNRDTCGILGGNETKIVERRTFRLKVVEHLSWDAYDKEPGTFRLGHRDNKPIANRTFTIEMPDGSVIKKTTDSDGMIEVTCEQTCGGLGVRFEPENAELNNSYYLYYNRIVPFKTEA